MPSLMFVYNMESAINGIVNLGTGIAGLIANKRTQKRQIKEQRKAEQREEKRRQQALLNDPSMMRQGYQKAGLNTGNLQPTANTVGSSSAPNLESSAPYITGLGSSLIQGLSAGEALHSQQLDNALKQQEIDNNQGYVDFMKTWFGKGNRGTMDAMMQSADYNGKILDNDMKASDNEINKRLNIWKINHPQYFDAVNEIPFLTRDKMFHDLRRLKSENDFSDWYDEIRREVAKIDRDMKRHGLNVSKYEHRRKKWTDFRDDLEHEQDRDFLLTDRKLDLQSKRMGLHQQGLDVSYDLPNIIHDDTLSYGQKALNVWESMLRSMFKSINISSYSGVVKK